VDNFSLLVEWKKDYCKKLVELLPHFDLVIVADYGHGMITEKTVKIIEENSNFLAINTQLNSFNLGFHSISKYNKADYVCVHEGELRHDYRNRSDSVESLIKDLSKKLNTDRITITRGTKGSIGYNKEEFIECPALSGKIIDRIGAGDSLYALTSMCFAADIPADITLFLGNIAASYKLTYHGNKHKIKKVDLIKAITAIFK